jgi:hypothetical protein
MFAKLWGKGHVMHAKALGIQTHVTYLAFRVRGALTSIVSNFMSHGITLHAQAAMIADINTQAFSDRGCVDRCGLLSNCYGARGFSRTLVKDVSKSRMLLIIAQWPLSQASDIKLCKGSFMFVLRVMMVNICHSASS